MRAKRKNYLDYVENPDSCVIIPEIGISTLLIDKEDQYNHSHNYFEIFYLISGNDTHVLNNKKEELNLGNCVLLKPNSDSQYFIRNKECIHRDIVITKEFFKELCEFLSPLYKQIFMQDFINKICLTKEEIALLENKIQIFSKETDLIKKKSIGSYVVFFILNKFFENINYPNTINKDNDPIIVDIIECFNRTDILQQRIATIIEPLGYTHSYLCKYFKSHTGKTLTEYFNLTKLNYATYYLTYSTYSIRQICNIIGFVSTSYLNKIFKKEYGITPSEYRRNLKK